MKAAKKIVLSASRRTDIPAFYMPWFMERINKGFFEVVNPFSRAVSVVPATPDNVHTIVFWSKNFGLFIREQFGARLQKLGYHLFFNFTINSHSPILEPNVPPLGERLEQLRCLSDQHGGDAINWRFDPICFYKTHRGSVHSNLNDLGYIAAKAAECGVTRCITSFMDHYPKIKRRIPAQSGLTFVDPPLERKVAIILEIEKELSVRNIHLSACCEKGVVEALPPDASTTNSACIPNDLLMDLFGGFLSLKKDRGQRVASGCGCKVSIDVGSYRQQPCFHNCLFCYANPTPPAA